MMAAAMPFSSILDSFFNINKNHDINKHINNRSWQCLANMVNVLLSRLNHELSNYSSFEVDILKLNVFN